MKNTVCLADAHHKSSWNLSCNLVLIEIKRSLWLNKLIYAWASKLGDKGILSNTASNVCGFGSLCQTWFRITKIQIICYIMATLWSWEKGWRSMPKKQAVPTEWPTWPSSPSSSLTKWRRNIQGKIPSANRNGTCFCWKKCSTMLLLCNIMSFKGTLQNSPRTIWDSHGAP